MELTIALLDSFPQSAADKEDLRLIGLAYASLGAREKAARTLRASLEGVHVPESPRDLQLQEKAFWDDGDEGEYHAVQNMTRDELARQAAEEQLDKPLSEENLASLEGLFFPQRQKD